MKPLHPEMPFGDVFFSRKYAGGIPACCGAGCGPPQRFNSHTRCFFRANHASLSAVFGMVNVKGYDSVKVPASSYLARIKAIRLKKSRE
nr:hypothetical protein [Mesorhizobium ciceri]